MPDLSQSPLSQRFERAVEDLEENLLKPLAARRLDATEISSFYKSRNFVRGWEINYQSSKGETKLRLLITDNFPFAPPSLALSPAPPPLTYPHVENDGVLCLLSNSATVSPYQPVKVAEALLGDAYNLLEDSFSGRNKEDFRLEFLSYWNRALTDEDLKFVSLIKTEPPSRSIVLWRGIRRYVFAEDEQSLKNWLENRFGKKNYQFERAGFLWLPEPLMPSDYPKTNAGVMRIGNKTGDTTGVRVLEKLAGESPSQMSVLIGSRSELGVCLAGVSIRKPQNSTSAHIKTKNLLIKGFRPGHVPASIIADRYLQSTNSASRYDVERADASWIHGRDENSSQQELFSKTVVVIGCGSIGGPLAKILAMSGIGELFLIDPEDLTWANTGRHFLGAKYVGFSKSESTAQEIKENFPHLTVEFRKESWQRVAKKEPEIFRSADLIVSLTGNWSAEIALNEWQQDDESMPKIIYGWTEPFAVAGHSVVIVKKSGCLQCQMNESGVPKLYAAEWENRETLKQEPACGVMYQPYGPIEITNSVNLIAETVVDVLLNEIAVSSEKIWVCKESLLDSTGGKWTKEWLELNGGNVLGGFSIDRDWTKTKTCPYCNNL